MEQNLYRRLPHDSSMLRLRGQYGKLSPRILLPIEFRSAPFIRKYGAEKLPHNSVLHNSAHLPSLLLLSHFPLLLLLPLIPGLRFLPGMPGLLLL